MRRIFALLVLATAVACGGGSDAVAPPPQSQGTAFSGTYVLQTVNGKALPVSWAFNSGDSLTIRSYSISIGGSGSWTSTMNEHLFTSGQASDSTNATQSGSYTYNASTKAVTLISTDQSTLLNGSVSTDFTTMTLAENTDVFVFKR